MTIKQAKAELKKYGRVEFRGLVFAESLRMRNNWQEYTGLYKVWRKDEMDSLHQDAMGLTAIFKFAAPYFQ